MVMRVNLPAKRITLNPPRLSRSRRMQRNSRPLLPGLGASAKGPSLPGGANPFELQSLLENAIAHHKAGRAEAAERGYNDVLQRVPNQPDALNLLAVLAVEAGNHVAAADLFERAVAIRPKDPVILNNAGNALFLTRRYEEAIRNLEQALALNPGFPDAWLNYGRALNAAGKPSDALRAFGQLQRLKPDSLGAMMGIARAHTELGQFDKAEEAARALIAKSPDSSSGYVVLANLRKFKADDPEIAVIEDLLASDRMTPTERRGVNYAAGKMYDDIGRYDDAFAQYDAANSSRGLVYDHAGLVRDYDLAIKTFTPKYFRDRSGWGSPSTRPIFIVGMPRSGTTLVETILGAHSSVYAAGELEGIKLLDRQNGDLVARPSSPYANAPNLTWFGVDVLAQRYLDFIARKNATAAHVTDKMPHNFQNIGLIATLFPNAKIVHCRRHPLDTLLSVWMQNFNDGHAYSAKLTDGARHYREYQRLMAHWESVLPGRIHTVDYEDVVSDQEAATRALLAFIGLPWEDACLQFHKVERTVLTASTWQVRQPLYSRSKGRWTHYERHLGEARAILGL
jgi:tetratricopeptide (TPR) repeat protein